MAEWRRVLVAEVAAEKGLVGGPFGSSLGGKDYVPMGVPVIRGANLGSLGKFSPRGFVYVTPEKARGQLARNLAVPGDVIFTQRGTLGQVGIVPSGPYDEYVISQSQMRLRVNRDVVLPDFVYYHFRSPEMVTEINNRAIATGVPHINLGILSRLKISLPPLKVQQGIVALLGALDDKIAVNERIAATTRALGLALYVQSTHDGDSVEVAVESITAAMARGVAPRYTDSSDELTVLNQKCVRGGRVNLEPSRLTIRDKVNPPKLLRINDVLVNSTGVGTLGRVARWTLEQEATVDSHVTIVRFDENKVDPVCAGFAMLRAQPMIEAMGEGSTGQTELRRSQIGELRISLPGPAGQKQLRPKLDVLEERADQVAVESRTLAALRDTLLPQLMSGKLRVRDAERIVEDAV